MPPSYPAPYGQPYARPAQPGYPAFYPPPHQPLYPQQPPVAYPPQAFPPPTQPTYPPIAYPPQYAPPSQAPYPTQAPSQPLPAPPATLPPGGRQTAPDPSNGRGRSLGLTLGLIATGMTLVAAVLVVGVLAYRFNHSGTPSSRLPKWVTSLPAVASALSFVALGLHFLASRVSRAERKRLEALYTAAGAGAATSDLPMWLVWMRSGCSSVVRASAQVVTAVVVVASVGTTVAGSALVARVANVTPTPTATATATPTVTPTATPSGPQIANTQQITDSRLRQANNITVAPDGSLWWSGQGGFGHLDTSGAITAVAYPSAWSTSRFGESMVAGPDGNMWFTEYTTASTPASANHVGKLTPAGAITEYPLTHADNGPSAIVVGPDGNIWFTEVGNRSSGTQPFDDGAIGRVTSSGAVTEFKLPQSGMYPAGLTKGPDNNLWFTAVLAPVATTGGSPTVTTDYVGRITPAGAITLYAMPGQADEMGDIITGPDGAFWFGVGNENTTTAKQPARIVRVTTSGQFLPPISLTSLGTTSVEYGLPSNFVIAGNGAVYFSTFEYRTSVTAGTVVYGPLLYDTPQGAQSGALGSVSNLECYAVSAGQNGSVTCAEDSDIQTVTP